MGLAAKLNRVVIALFVLAAILYTVLILYFQQQRIEMTADKISVFIASIANNNSKSLANELFENRPRAIKLRLESILNIKGIAHAVVLDLDGGVVVEAGSVGEDLKFSVSSLPAKAIHWIQDDELLFFTPIREYNEIFGYLLLGYPLSDLQKEESFNLLSFALSLFFFMLLTLILLNTFSRKCIVAPLNDLIAAMGEVKPGALGGQLEVRGSEEIQHLSSSFNTMSDQISLSYVKIKKNRQFVEQIIDTIDSILISIASDNRVTAWNEAAVHYTGIGKNKAVGEDLFILFPKLLSFKIQIDKTVQQSTDDFIHHHRMGVSLYNIYIYPLPDKNRQGALVRLDDITEIEEKENQLRQSQKMETVGQLTGGIAHDFNNMLSGMLGAAELLKLKTHSPKNAQYFDIILDSGWRAADLVAKLLAFSRKNKLEIRTLDVHEALDASIALLKRSIHKNITLHTHFTPLNSVIQGDMTELQNSFLNLGINASQAMLDGGELSYSTRQVTRDEIPGELTLPASDARNYIEIMVTDTGVGIPVKNIDSIFEPFFTTKEQGKGTGLGLSTVYGTVRQHYGIITVESTPGTGTTFRLYFPLSGKQNLAADTDNLQFKKGSGCILVVDDEVIVRTVAKELLESLGYSVLLAENGREGEEVFVKNRDTIDLVLLDMLMPELNGVGCFFALRKVDPHIKIILSSGYAPDVELEKLRDQGAAGFLQKPYQLRALSEMVADVILLP